MALKGLSYWVRNNLYIALTNDCNSMSPIALRGPGFKMPESSFFTPLLVEPTAEDVYNAVNDAFESNKIAVDSMKSAAITYAGLGEPLLRMNVLCESAKMIKSSRHGVPLRVKTNGLILSNQSFDVASTLKASGIKHMAITLVSNNPTQYNQIMKPTSEANFSDVCAFIVNCAEVGLEVTCTAPETPGVDLKAVRELAYSLGATSFSTSSYHP